MPYVLARSSWCGVTVKHTQYADTPIVYQHIVCKEASQNTLYIIRRIIKVPGPHCGGTRSLSTTYGATALCVVHSDIVPGQWAGTFPNLIYL